MQVTGDVNVPAGRVSFFALGGAEVGPYDGRDEVTGGLLINRPICAPRRARIAWLHDLLFLLAGSSLAHACKGSVELEHSKLCCDELQYAACGMMLACMHMCGVACWSTAQ